MNLDYITRSNSEPEGKPKVYFSCHPEDFSEAFPLITADLFKHANCTVWYDADAAGPDHCGKANSMYAAAEKPEDLLTEMQLFVVAVTSKFLHEENRAKDIELPLVLQNHIPVLPVMLENGLEHEFNEICGEIQVVSKYGKDPTAIPYDEVLQTFLDSVLVGNELAEQVRSAFDAYIFMSYRKKDRKHAQRLMRLIHENKLFRDIAIWYDEFLVPGEGFNKAIRDAFAKSSLFAMTVTPHLEEEGNYVMREEYPMARDRQEKDDKFEIIPVEMYGPEDRINGKDWRIDQSDLKDKDFKYKEIRNLKDEHRPEELNQSLINALTRIARKQNDGSSYHKFFIGLAYLNGIDMEINRKRALELITEAANEPSPCPEAAAKLADMYFYGEGVDPDPAQAVFWQKKLADLYKAAYDIHHDPDEHFGYGTEAFKALQKLSDMYKNFGDIQKAIKTAEQALSFSEGLIPEVGIREQERDSAVILNRLGNLYLEMEDLSAAEDCFIKAGRIYGKQASEIGTDRAQRDLSISYERLGDICRRKGDSDGAESYYLKSQTLRKKLFEASKTAASRRDLSFILTKLGNVKKNRKDYAEAEQYYRKALSMDKGLAEEILSPQAWDDYGVSLIKLGDIQKAEERHEEAAGSYQAACDIFRQKADKTGSVIFLDHLAGGEAKLAGVKKQTGGKQEAQQLYKESVKLREQLYETGKTASAARALAAVCFNLAVFLKDKNLLKRAYELWNEPGVQVFRQEEQDDFWEDFESLSLSLSKEAVLEEMEKADDGKTGIRAAKGPISNEEITKENRILDTYEVISDAIPGGMGSVWKVHHDDWNTDLAMKRPKPEFFAEGSKERKDNFIHECDAWINLGLHPNIVSCYYVREIGGVPTIFSEWMENGSLRNRIDDKTLYDGSQEEVQERLLDIAIQSARGLHYAHESGEQLIHQDVKPDNLLLTKEWETKVADFGLAKARGILKMDEEAFPNNVSGEQAAVTRMSATGGYTLHYCSPEQFLGKSLTRRSDIYSWAVTILEMYLGERHWNIGFEAGKNCCRYYSEKGRAAIPASLQALLTKCLAENADERPRDFSAVEQELKKIYLETIGTAYPREESGAASNTADTLNNKALSFLDLGMDEAAEACWNEALRQDPKHVDAAYNRGLYLIRREKKYDYEVISELEDLREVKESGVIQDILREFGDPAENLIFEGKKTVPDINERSSAAVTGNELVVSDWAIPKILFINTETGTVTETDKMEEIRKLDPEAFVSTMSDEKAYAAVLSPDAQLTAVIFRNGLVCLYDNVRKKILQTVRVNELIRPVIWITDSSGWEPFENNTKYDRFQFSADGRLLVCYSDKPPVLLLEIPSLTVRRLPRNIRFAATLRDGSVLLHRKVSKTNESLCTAVYGKETLTEVFRFEYPLKSFHETNCGPVPFLAYTDEVTEDRFYLDDTFQKIPIHNLSLWEASGNVITYDPKKELLYTCLSERGAKNGSHLLVWDLKKQKLSRTVAYDREWENAACYEAGNAMVLCRFDPYDVQWVRLTLPGRPEDDKAYEPAKWRVSHIVTVVQRKKEEDRLGGLEKEFWKAYEQGDLSKAVSVHNTCCEVPGFFDTDFADRMAAALDPCCEKKSLLAARPLSVIPELPAGVYEGKGKQLRRCDTDIFAVYHRNIIPRTVVLSKADGTLIRKLVFPSFVCSIEVRGDRIYAFTDMLDCAIYDLQGNFLHTLPEGMEWPPKRGKVRTNLGNCGARYPVFYDVDEEGKNILYSMTADKDPYGKAKDIYGNPWGQGLYQRNLQTGKVTIITQVRYLSGIQYMKDGNVLLPGKLLPNGRQYSSSLKYLEIKSVPGWETSELSIDPEGNRQERSLIDLSFFNEKKMLILRLKKTGEEGTDCAVFDAADRILDEWNVKAGYHLIHLAIPDSWLVCEDTGKEVHIRDLIQRKTVFTEKADFSSDNAHTNIAIRPDGRELYISRGGTHYAYRLEFEYGETGPGSDSQKALSKDISALV